MRIQFGARLVANNAKEFKAMERSLDRKPGEKRWVETDFAVDRMDRTYPRYVLTDEHRDAFWSLACSTSDDDVFTKRTQEMKELFENLPPHHLDALARAVEDLKKKTRAHLWGVLTGEID